MNTTTSQWMLGLGAGGLLPFFGCAAALILLPGEHDAALGALLAYAAVILSFLGAVHWGFVLAQGNAADAGLRLGLGVVPSLIGWLALLLGQFALARAGITLALLGFAATFAVEMIWRREGWLPDAYFRLRMTLTTLVGLTLLAVLIASILGSHV